MVGRRVAMETGRDQKHWQENLVFRGCFKLGMCNPPGPHCHTRRSWSRTRDSGAGGGRSNKECQRLQPLASVARAPLFEVRRVRFYTQPLLA